MAAPAQDEFVDLYEVLDLPTDAESDEIRQRINTLYLEAQQNLDHRNLKKRLHFQQRYEIYLPQARHLLLDVRRRDEYDRYLTAYRTGSKVVPSEEPAAPATTTTASEISKVSEPPLENLSDLNVDPEVLAAAREDMWAKWKHGLETVSESAPTQPLPQTSAAPSTPAPSTPMPSAEGASAAFTLNASETAESDASGSAEPRASVQPATSAPATSAPATSTSEASAPATTASSPPRPSPPASVSTSSAPPVPRPARPRPRPPAPRAGQESDSPSRPTPPHGKRVTSPGKETMSEAEAHDAAVAAEMERQREQQRYEIIRHAVQNAGLLWSAIFGGVIFALGCVALLMLDGKFKPNYPLGLSQGGFAGTGLLIVLTLAFICGWIAHRQARRLTLAHLSSLSREELMRRS